MSNGRVLFGVLQSNVLFKRRLEDVLIFVLIGSAFNSKLNQPNNTVDKKNK